jgi:hypothetical protein
MQKIKINDTEYPIKYGLKAELRLEKEKGVTFGVDTLGTEASMLFHYYAILCGCEKMRQAVTMTFEQFIDACDDDKNIINQLNNLLLESYSEKKN